MEHAFVRSQGTPLYYPNSVVPVGRIFRCFVCVGVAKGASGWKK